MTAVDFVLEPDETMLERARIVNARRLGVYPQGFPLDAALCHSGAKAEGRRPETPAVTVPAISCLTFIRVPVCNSRRINGVG